MRKTRCISLELSSRALAREVLDCQFEQDDGLRNRYSETQIERCLKDIEYHIRFLCNAVRYNSPVLIQSYAEWVSLLMEGLDISIDETIESLRCLADIVGEKEPPEISDTINDFIETAILTMTTRNDIPAYFGKDSMFSLLATQYMNSLLNEDLAIASDIVWNTLKEGTKPTEIYEKIFIPVQREIGRLWLSNKIDVAQEHYCTEATRKIMAQLQPHIYSKERIGRKVLLLCVSGELHDFGPRVLADYFEMNGWDTIFLGANTPDTSIVNSVQRIRPDIIAISATMTFHISHVENAITNIRNLDPGKQPKILVGGLPFSQDRELWKRVGADGFALDAKGAIEEATRLLLN